MRKRVVLRQSSISALLDGLASTCTWPVLPPVYEYDGPAILFPGGYLAVEVPEERMTISPETGGHITEKRFLEPIRGRLLVREAYRIVWRETPVCTVEYKVDGEQRMQVDRPGIPEGKWMTGIWMPDEFGRLWLRIKRSRFLLLSQVTEEFAKGDLTPYSMIYRGWEKHSWKERFIECLDWRVWEQEVDIMLNPLLECWEFELERLEVVE